MNSIEHIIMMAAATGLTVFVISIAYHYTDTSTTNANTAVAATVEVVNQIADYKINRYDGEILTGAKVKHLIEQYKEDGVQISVTTYWYNLKNGITDIEGVPFQNYNSIDGAIDNSLFDLVTYTASEYYIADYWFFETYVTRNANGGLSRISFVEKKE